MTDSPPTPTSAPPSPAPPRRSNRRLYIALFVTLAVAMLYLATHITVHFELRKEIETSANAGHFEKLESFVGLQSALSTHIAASRKSLVETGNLIREPAQELIPLLPLLGSAPIPASGQRLSPDQLAAVESFLAANAAALDDDNHPYYLTREVESLRRQETAEPAHVIASRKLNRLLWLRTIAAAHRGRAEHLALNDILTSAKNNRDARFIGFTTHRANLSSSVRLAEYLMNLPGRGSSPFDHVHTLADLLVLDSDTEGYDFRAALQIELTFGHNDLNESLDTTQPHDLSLPPHESLWKCNRFALLHHTRHIGYLSAMNQLIDAAGTPHHERIERFGAAWREIQTGPDFLYDYAKQRITAYPTALHLDMLVEARARAARAAMLVLIYYQSEGRLPASLDDLTHLKAGSGGSWLTKMLTRPAPLPLPDPDPYTGRPLLYKTLPSGGFTVYSVGEDGVDHGGVRTNDSGQDFGPGADVPFTILQLPPR